MPSKIVRLPNAAKIYGGIEGIIAEVMEITPIDAAAWLKANQNNRPVRRRHVDFLAREIMMGNWQVNGQAIIIADGDEVLDGQHRLLAIIEAGKPIRSMVVWGISVEAFKTMDTGAVRSGADALFMHLKDGGVAVVKSAATAAQICNQLDRGIFSGRVRLSNTDVIEYVKKYPTILRCAETLQGYPHDTKPIPLGPGAGLYEMFRRKRSDAADTFMKNLYTGEGLTRTNVEYVLRVALQKDAAQVRRLPINVRLRMVIKGWNWLRRGNTEATRATITVQPTEDDEVKIF